MSDFSVVTTFPAVEYEVYARRMIESFDRFWPAGVSLHVYYEDMARPDLDVSERIRFHDFHAYAPAWRAFADRYGELEKTRRGYRFAASRFAHKVYAIMAHMAESESRYVVWLDADTRTYIELPLQVLEVLVYDGRYMSYLGRDHVEDLDFKHSECGFMIFDTHHPLHTAFWDEMRRMYDDGGLFELPQWHDSFVFDHVRMTLEHTRGLKNFDICRYGLEPLGTGEHVFVMSVLGKFMDHVKGQRKTQGISPEFRDRHQPGK